MMAAMRTATRTVTILFTDLVGSTELAARLGSSASEDLRTHHFSTIRSALAVHRGDEVKTLGDGFMAAFDSSSDAIACAVTMQRSVARHNRQEPQREIGMRVGVSAGEATREGDDYFGMPVVEASRLCAAAQSGQILAADVVRVLVGSQAMHTLEPVAPMSLKGLPQPTVAWEVCWDADEGSALRVALAEDSVLLREGIARVLESESIDVVLQASNAEELLQGIDAARPHVVVCDVRMPPTHTDEGIRAAERIRAERRDIGVIVLSASIEPGAAARLLSDSTDGIGYLLKERVTDINELTAAIRTVASGGSAIDPHVIDLLPRPGALAA
jgi:class 3 adenylate cyclase